MEKVVVEVFVPTINKSYDFSIPCYMAVSDLTSLITKTINEHEGISINTEQTILCRSDTGEMIRNNCLVSQANIVDGSKVIIV